MRVLVLDLPHRHHRRLGLVPDTGPGSLVRRRLQDYGLGLFFGLLFLLALVGQAVAGVAEFNQQQQAHGGASLSLLQYVASADFAVDVAENWQSEYPQFLLYIVATVWLVHRGSPESKELNRPAEAATRTSCSAPTRARTPRPGRGREAGAPRCSRTRYRS